MASIGPSYPGTGADNGTGVAFANPSRVTAEDASTSDAVSITTTASGLKATDFSAAFAAMADADTVDGIVVETYCRKGTVGTLLDDTIQLIVAGTPSGNNNSAAAGWQNSGATLFRQSYGSSSDKWGLTLTGADMKNTGFGYLHKAKRSGKTAVDGNVDSMRMTVYYTVAATGQALLDDSADLAFAIEEF